MQVIWDKTSRLAVISEYLNVRIPRAVVHYWLQSNQKL